MSFKRDGERGRNLTALMDFYELTMAKGYFNNGMGDTTAVFDMFFRRVPDGGGLQLWPVCNS